MTPELFGVAVRRLRVAILSLARALGEIPEVDIQFIGSSNDPEVLQHQADVFCITLCRGLRRSMSAMWVRQHWSHCGSPAIFQEEI